MDGSTKANGYSGYTAGSLTSSTSTKHPVGTQDGYTPPNNTKRYEYLISGLQIESHTHNNIIIDTNTNN